MLNRIQLTQYLLQIAAILILRILSVHTERNDQKIVDLIKIKLTDYFTPLENCTIITYTTKHLDIRANNFAPIILTIYDQNTSSTTGGIICQRFSLQRRRNLSSFCWATFYPKKAADLTRKIYISCNYLPTLGQIGLHNILFS